LLLFCDFKAVEQRKGVKGYLHSQKAKKALKSLLIAKFFLWVFSPGSKRVQNCFSLLSV